MLRFAVAGFALILAYAGSAPPVLAAPANEDCVNCAPQKPYDSESPARIRQEMDRPPVPAANTTAPVVDRAPYPDRSAVTPPTQDCADCPPPKRYDSTEVVKTSRDVDQSRVINTESVVQVPPRTKESNHLIVHENEIRNVGVVQHNHRIIEKEIRYVRRAPVYQHYAPTYRVRVQTVYVPVVTQPATPCGCPCTCYASQSAYAPQPQTYVYGGGYAYRSERVAVQQVLVPVTVPAGYGYGYSYR